MGLCFYLYYNNDNNYIEVFSKNITHNLGLMADKADIYKVLWRPDENNYIYAKDIIEILELGYISLQENPEYYKEFNSDNGWGIYEHFVIFVEEVLNACKQYPNAIIKVSR